jgi:hypothetical protein
MFWQSIRGGLGVLLHWETTVLIVCALVSPVDAIEVDISGQRIAIPSPMGFSEVGRTRPGGLPLF